MSELHQTNEGSRVSRCTQEHLAQFVSHSQSHLLPFPSCPLSSRLHTRCLYPWGKPTALQDRALWDWAARQTEGISSMLPTSPLSAPGFQLTFPQRTAEPPPTPAPYLFQNSMWLGLCPCSPIQGVFPSRLRQGNTKKALGPQRAFIKCPRIPPSSWQISPVGLCPAP